ncbi:MAG: TRAP transporter small permease [Bacillota bacterium]|nr:TRAP transporter small permease [Bacillota bacterium]
MGNRIKNLFLNMDDFFASVSLVIIVVVTILGVFMRYVVGDPLKWTEEVLLAMFVWFTFWGASSVTKRDGHVSIDYLVDKLPIGMQRVLSIFRLLVIIMVTSVVLILLGYQLSAQAWNKLTPILGIRYTFIDLAVPMGGILALIHLIRQLIIRIRLNSTTPEGKE